MAVARPDEAHAESPRCESVEQLFHALEAPLLSYALRLLKNMTAAEDIVQEAFLKLHAQFAEVREPRHWLYRTVHNLALNHRRNNRKIVPLDSSSEDCDGVALDAADLQPLPDEQIARWEAIGLVRLSLESLDARSRELVRLKFNEDLSYKEIAGKTGLTVGHVGYLLHHALKAVAAELAKIGVMP
jgi:RNA polymerase sigma factor (sigma-70 family)